MTDRQDPDARKWIDEAEEALTRARDAVRAAWEGTRDARIATLEAAKEAADKLSNAIDQGMEVARGAWDSSKEQQPPGDDLPATSTPMSDGTQSLEEE